MADEPAREEGPRHTLSQEVAGSLMGGTIGAVLGGPAGAIVGATVSPAMTEMTRKVIGEFSARRDQSAVGVVDTAAEDLGMDADEMETRIRSTPGGLELAGEAIWAGWQTINAQKVRALGRALANGLRDDGARIDRERLVIAALAELEEPHIRALAVIGSKPSKDPWPPIRHWSTDQLRAELGLGYPGSDAEILVAVLARSALIEDQNAPRRQPLDVIQQSPRKADSGNQLGPREAHWLITDFGMRCLDYLRTQPDAGANE